MSTVREIHTGWGPHKERSDTFRVYAECADELTAMILVNPTVELRAMFLVSEDAVADSPAYRQLVADHQSRCSSCQAWLLQASA